MKHANTASRTSLYEMPEGRTHPLNVAIVVPPVVPAWVLKLNELAADQGWLRLSLYPATAAELAPVVPGPGIMLRAALALEHAALGRSHALSRVAMPFRAGSDAAAWQDPTSLFEHLGAQRPDLVILLGPRAWTHELSSRALYGCWHVEPSLLDERFAGLSLLSPMLRGDLTTRLGLRLTPEGGDPIDLAGGTTQTRAGSFIRQREAAFRKLPALLLRALHRLAHDDVALPDHAVAELSLPPQAPVGRAAGLGALLLIAKAALRRARGRRRDGSVGWTLALRLSGQPIDPSKPELGSHALLRPDVGWWADPFVVCANERRLIFVEEMEDPRLNNANIACVEISDGQARRLGTALDEPGHLSYPQVLHWQGQWYMTVESSYDRRISLYRATRFPLAWSRVRDLVSGQVCVDPTLHYQDGHWYLFTSISENETSTSDDLFLFVSDAIDGPYRPHPASPIVCDVGRARMAGKLFVHHGKLIRPAQDCGPCYGNAIVFNEVLELSPWIYRERPISRLAHQIGRGSMGCHTYNADGPIEVLDLFGRPPIGQACLHVVDALDQVSSPSAPFSATAPREDVPGPIQLER
ncbi:hypothetical protein N800_08680 [Lysobacter daejeonensis GH1-9]|uniref:Glucosamine inositolphosphorylceramide transferase 1 N-terminal domain-containing protein n=1 Tax=Lysobacter daejeonensis GH1-9 TaxID=1385517 RepID=A0A0A0F4F3_9GAMM|nr:hypothetical protein [Lysobacter daejeonensis]KGM56267.1 hypothetical protein N800_08680 [Lysobacter daejeonensis GH1-9]